MVHIGLDVGTTHITALALESDTGQVLACESLANSAEITCPSHQARGWSEWDAEGMIGIAWQAIQKTAAALPDPSRVRAIGVCGQMHGVCIVSPSLRPLTSFIGWQDQRGEERATPEEATVVEKAQALAGVGRLATGYGTVTLYWLQQHDRLGPPGALACSIPDLAAAWLAGERPATDPSNASSLGCYDSRLARWDWEAIRRLGLPAELFPPIQPAPSILGSLRPDLAREAGLANDVSVAVAIGDNQASFAGSVRAPQRSIALNLGTGGQLSLRTDVYLEDDGFETRPYMEGSYLMVHAELAGGHAYALWHRFLTEVGRDLLGIPEEGLRDEVLYERMNRLAAQAPPGAEGLVCEPTFAGARQNPDQRGSWRGIGPGNLHPGHMTRALLEGLIEGFFRAYQHISRSEIQSRKILVASGNALRRNPLLCRIAGQAFQMPVRIPLHEEEAAYGAALMAAVSRGAFRDLASAGRIIRYREEEKEE